MSETIKYWVGFTILFILIGIVIMLRYNLSCLEEISKKVCSEKGQNYINFVIGFPLMGQSYFTCSENERALEDEKFVFLKEELNQCRRFKWKMK